MDLRTDLELVVGVQGNTTRSYRQHVEFLTQYVLICRYCSFLWLSSILVKFIQLPEPFDYFPVVQREF